MAVGIAPVETVVDVAIWGFNANAEDGSCVGIDEVSEIEVGEVDGEIGLLSLDDVGSAIVGVSPSAVKLASGTVVVGEFPTVSFAIESKAVVLGVRVETLGAVLGATSRATSSEEPFVGSLDIILEEDIEGLPEGLLVVELVLRKVVDVGNWASMDVEEPLKRLAIAGSNWLARPAATKPKESKLTKWDI